MIGRLVTAGLSFATYYIAFQYARASEVILVFSTNTIMAAVFAYLYLHEKVARLEVFLILTAFCGVAMLCLSNSK